MRGPPQKRRGARRGAPSKHRQPQPQESGENKQASASAQALPSYNLPLHCVPTLAANQVARRRKLCGGGWPG
jgi:hypothetical protein